MGELADPKISAGCGHLVGIIHTKGPHPQITPRHSEPIPTQPPLTFAGAATNAYRAYAAGTPPSTLSMFPVLLPDRAGEAKCRTAWAMSSGKMFTPSVVRLR